MAFLSSLNMVGSGLTAQQLRLDVISENVVNINTTRTEGGGPYRRKITVFEAMDDRNSFRNVLARTQQGAVSNRRGDTAGGVRVTQIVEDPSALKLTYDPDHPDANGDGYVELPNVDMVKEMTDGMAASQAYSANVTALNMLKTVISKGLEIGK